MALLLVLLVLVCLACSFVVAGLGFASVRRLLARPVPAPVALPGVSVLKPLKGVDRGLYENLTSIVRQDYPGFEVLFGVEDPDDPAVEVAFRVKRENPDVAIRILTGAPAVGMNPKVNNLLHISRFARHDLVLISDSNVRVGPDYLRALAAELADSSVGLVHSVLVGADETAVAKSPAMGTEGPETKPKGAPAAGATGGGRQCGDSLGDTVGSLLENLQMNTVTAYGVCGMQVLSGLPLVVGKSMLFRLSDLDRLGGLLSVANVLAEDYVLGRKFHAAGYTVQLSPYRVTAINGGWSLQRFWNRQLRWSQMRRHLATTAYVFEPLMNTFLWSVLLVPAALAADLTAPVRAALLALAPLAVAARASLDSAQVARLRGRRLRAGELVWLPFKDVLLFVLWACGLFKRTIDWRGTVARIGKGSVLTAASRPAPREPAVWSS